MWYIRTIKYYSALKRNRVLIHAKIWMNLENIMLSKSDTEDHLVFASIYTKCPEVGKFIDKM